MSPVSGRRTSDAPTVRMTLPAEIVDRAVLTGAQLSVWLSAGSGRLILDGKGVDNDTLGSGARRWSHARADAFDVGRGVPRSGSSGDGRRSGWRSHLVARRNSSRRWPRSTRALARFCAASASESRWARLFRNTAPPCDWPEIAAIEAASTVESTKISETPSRRHPCQRGRRRCRCPSMRSLGDGAQSM